MKTVLRALKTLPHFIILTGCIQLHTAYYNIDLKEVERPAKTKERYGEQKISKINENGIDKYTFEDEMVKIIWLPTAQNVNFELTNKTNHSIKIIWDETVFVDPKRASHKVMHSGVKYIDRNNSQPPSVIVKNGSISDVLIPTDGVMFLGSSWIESPIFLNQGTDQAQLKVSAESYIGNIIQVLLPLQIEGVINEYLFSFEVKSVVIK